MMMNRLLLMIGVLLFFCGCTECDCENCGICNCPDEVPNETPDETPDETPEKVVVEVIEFEDPLVKSISVAYWDTDNDNELSYEEAAAVSSMGGVFAYKSISTFNELQYFTGLTAIEENTFLECKQLTSIALPERITAIGNKAFYECAQLQSIAIPEGVKSIGNQAFYNCVSISNPQSLESIVHIGSAAFRSCEKIPQIYLGKNVQIIDESAFFSCNSLKSVYCEAELPPIIGQYVFYTTARDNIGPPLDESIPNLTIYVPQESVYEYEYADNWETYRIQGYDFNQD